MPNAIQCGLVFTALALVMIRCEALDAVLTHRETIVSKSLNIADGFCAIISCVHTNEEASIDCPINHDHWQDGQSMMPPSIEHPTIHTLFENATMQTQTQPMNILLTHLTTRLMHSGMP
jgi:hypothetical protein